MKPAREIHDLSPPHLPPPYPNSFGFEKEEEKGKECLTCNLFKLFFRGREVGEDLDNFLLKISSSEKLVWTFV